MTRPVQPDLFTHIERTIIRIADDQARGVDLGHDFLASDDGRCVPRPGVPVPEWLRFPGEHGHVELDANMRPVKR